MVGDSEGDTYRPDEASLRAFEESFLRAHGPLPPPAACPIGWQPSALTPVFYGVRDYGPADGAPLTLRIFFPSLDGDVFTANMLTGCGRYPAIVFCHGDCHPDITEHYKKWFVLPAQLARSGYVVMVPQLLGISSHPSGNGGTQQALVDALNWLRDSWEHRDALLPSPATGIAGHSFGGLHAGILATNVPARAVAYLSGVWVDWPSGTRPIEVLTLPQLFTWGTDALSERDAILPEGFWQQLGRPRHRAIFANGQHWDYLFNEQTPCDSSRGPCHRVGWAAMDLVTMFFGKYLPPELWPNLPDRIPDDLRPPTPLDLTLQQQFYAGGHLVGFDLFEADSTCSVTIEADLLSDRTVPFVRFLPRSLADAHVRARDLVPHFTQPGGHGAAWVATQSPPGGHVVPAGSTVSMTLHTGPIP